MEEMVRQIIREEVRAAIGVDLAALRAEVEELRAGLPGELRGMLSLAEVAAFLGVKSEQTARAWLHRNGVKLRKVGSATRVLGADVHGAITKKK